MRQREENQMCRFVFILAMALLTLLPSGLSAGEREDRRAWAGLDLFPSLLAADGDITKKHGPDGELLLVLVYTDRKRFATDITQHLKKIGKIRGIPIRIELTQDTSLKGYEENPPAGIFIAERLFHRLDSIIQFGRRHHIIVFSPFEGDVEQGVPGGIVVSDRILPYINMKSMRLSKIQIKPFFMRIAEVIH
ncbi:MAG: hypothetical protein SVY10_18540 [Thermodesulfobacteriota bacterium]|nr:hypothetical protein [Thermodesulfobacteriota bacterium]